MSQQQHFTVAERQFLQLERMLTMESDIGHVCLDGDYLTKL